MSNFIKILPSGAELFHGDGQTADMTKLIVAFRNFPKASIKVEKYNISLPK
jgi:hypothetical protein